MNGLIRRYKLYLIFESESIKLNYVECYIIECLTKVFCGLHSSESFLDDEVYYFNMYNKEVFAYDPIYHIVIISYNYGWSEINHLPFTDNSQKKEIIKEWLEYNYELKINKII